MARLVSRARAGAQRGAALASCLATVLALATSGCRGRDASAAEGVASAPTTAPPSAASADASATPRATEAARAPACPAGEVFVPATPPEGFVMGQGLTKGLSGRAVGKGHRPDTDAPHRVVLTKPFCMDATEVTVRSYALCVEAGACALPKQAGSVLNYPAKVDHPVNDVSWPKARAYCGWAGKELPTEAQWEWAATGGEGRKWPWGDEPPTCEHADFTMGSLKSPSGDSGCHGGGTSPVGAHPKGDRVTPAGAIHDLAGNVWEWTLDSYAPYATGDATDPLVVDDGASLHVIRGGGWNRSVRGIMAAFRGAAVVGYEVPGLGFRCVRGLEVTPSRR